MEQAYLPGTVRQRIQDQLKERKITQGELAAAIGMAESSLSRFLSEKTDKIGDEYIIKIADFLGVSTDFILGQTDFPERRNYDIGELGLSYRAAMALYTREVDTDLMNMLREIKTGIQTQTPVTELATRQITQTMMESMVKGENAVPAVQAISLEQLAGAYSTLPGATPDSGTQFAGLIKNFIRDFMDIAQKQGLINGNLDE